MPLSFIAQYLRTVHAESVARGYRFDAGKVARRRTSRRIDVLQGQMDFEWHHLMDKLARRAPERHQLLLLESCPLPHPLFQVIPGGVADWERT